MATHAIAPNLLGLQAEQAIDRETRSFAALLERLPAEAWQETTAAGGATVVAVLAHLAEGAARLASAWQDQLDAEANEVLLHTFDDPATPPTVTMDTSDTGAVLASYRTATARLSQALSTVRQQDWVWPVWSPLGGIETLGEAARRWLAHHHVHRSDIAAALGLATETDEDATRLVAEFVLDAIARRGGEAITPPIVFEVVTSPPGAGTWSLVFDEPDDGADAEDVWQALVGRYPRPTHPHRVERGSSGRARLVVEATGELLWRAAFRRGASWSDVDVHGDDEARSAWDALLERVVSVTGAALGRVQH